MVEKEKTYIERRNSKVYGRKLKSDPFYIASNTISESEKSNLYVILYDTNRNFYTNHAYYSDEDEIIDTFFGTNKEAIQDANKRYGNKYNIIISEHDTLTRNRERKSSKPKIGLSMSKKALDRIHMIYGLPRGVLERDTEMVLSKKRNKKSSKRKICKCKK